jgi:hypothetical protein
VIAARWGIVGFALYASVCHADSSTCAYRESPITDSGVAVESGDPRVTAVELLSMTPGEQGRIDRHTIIEADVEFHIVDFQPGQFFLDVRFPTTYGSNSLGSRATRPNLRSAHGRAHLCVPLADIFDDPDVRWPLTAIVSVHQDLQGGGHRPVADSRLTTFSSFDVPADLEAKRASRPPEEYVHALMQAFSFYESPRVLNEVCSARFPAMQETFARTFPAWRARNARTIDFINALQIEQFKLGGKNSGEVARQIFESLRGSFKTEIEKFSDAQLNEMCRTMVRQLADPNYDNNGAIGNEMRIVREWEAKHPGPRPQ